MKTPKIPLVIFQDLENIIFCPLKFGCADKVNIDINAYSKKHFLFEIGIQKICQIIGKKENPRRCSY